MKNMKEEGPIFSSFLESNPKLVLALLGKYPSE